MVKKIRISVFWAVLGVIAIIAACATVPFDQPKPTSAVIVDTADTLLGRDIALWTQANTGLSGIYPLGRGMDALGMRLALAEMAEKSLDLQYFLMKEDTAGAVFTNALLKAADRGVRVRFLLDDVFTAAPDRDFLLMNQHPNIEVRLFNPISRSGNSGLNFLTSFKQANRRMHNKSFTADNQASVVGGRNIADEYFELKDAYVFADFDVLAVGPVVNEISDSFNEFWNHSHAIPIDYVASSKQNESLENVRAEVAEELDDVYDTIYARALNSQLLQDIFAGREQLFPAQARVLSDRPDKLINEISEEHMQLARDLREVILSAESELIFISPYYVPGDSGVRLLQNLTDKGLRVVILTNSLASNNHVPVHSGYAKYRKDVINAGGELYEVRANAAHALKDDGEGPEALTLHTKLILIDRRYLFVGSLNLDPRSIDINAEMGLLIDAPELVEDMALVVEKRLATAAYRLALDDRDKLEWHANINGEEVVETKDPLTSHWLRFKAWFMKIAPESQL